MREVKFRAWDKYQIMNRTSYLLCTTILATGLLLAAHLHDLNRQLDQEILEQMDDLLRLLEESETENRELREENLELERLHYIRAEQRTLLASRGGRSSIPVLSPSGMIAEHFERAFRELDKPGMFGLGEILCRVENETGVNALILAGIASLESSWGISLLAQEKCNLGGLGALDGVLGSAMTFKNRQECIFFLAELIADGGTLEDVGRWYASDPAWAAKVAGCMKLIGEAKP